MRAAFNRGVLPMKDVIEAAAVFATDPHRSVADEPMSFIGQAYDWLYDDALRGSVERYGRTLFHSVAQKLGWRAGKDDDADRVELRAQVLSFLAFTARDPGVRAEAKKLGLAFLGYAKDGALHLHPEAVDPNLVGIALGVVGEEVDQPLWDATRAQLAKTDDPGLRGRLLGVLLGPRKSALWPAVRALTFDPVLRTTEATSPVWSLLSQHETRDATWQWVKDNFDRLLTTVPQHHGRTQLISMGGEFCDEAHAQDLEAFFTPARVAHIDGGPRVLASTIEDMRLCAAKRKLQEPSARTFFAHAPK